MKGLKHQVIEINDTKSNEIEKILVFLKPGEHSINVANTRKDAQDILEKVKIDKIKKTNISPLQIIGFVSAVLFLSFIFINIF